MTCLCNRLSARQLILSLIVCFILVSSLYKLNLNLIRNRLANVMGSNTYPVTSDGRELEFDENDIRLPEQALDFIRETNLLKTKVFLIDPLLLYQMFDYKHKELLIKNDLLSKSMLKDILIQKQYCISFGIFHSDIQSIKTKLSPQLKRLSFNETLIEGLDGSQRSYKKNDSDINRVLLHMFYKKNNDCIQISVLHKRNDFLWMGRIHEPQSKYGLPKDIHFGRHESAFDMFGVRLLYTDFNDSTVSIHIPEESVYFMSQLQTSKFIECDYRRAQTFATKYSPDLLSSEAMDNKIREALIALKTFGKQLFIPIFISSGTLLGWYRQCGVIPYTSDLDAGTWAQYASDETTDKWIHNGVGLKLTYIYGLVDNGLQYAFYSESKLRVDLFFTYKEGNNLTYTGHTPSKKMYFRYIYPYFTLCSAELVGLKVLVPCNAEDVVSAEYGKYKWKVPKTSWNYDSSAFNIGPTHFWSTDEVAKRAFRQL